MSDEPDCAPAAPAFPDSSLRADCARCFGLCCVAPAFAASADFAVDKAAGKPCHNLRSDFRCGIHSDLRDRGFPGCTVYDCFGAGQKVSQITFGGQDWRRTPRIGGQMFTVFTIMRQLNELRWYLTEALTLPQARPLHDELAVALERTAHLTDSSPDDLVELDVAAHRHDVNALLLRTSELVRAGAGHIPRGIDHRGADLIGSNLRGADLRGREPEGCLPHRSGPHRRRPEDGRPHRSRPQGRGPRRRRPHREHLPHPVPARRGEGRRRDGVAADDHPPRALVLSGAQGRLPSNVTETAASDDTPSAAPPAVPAITSNAKRVTMLPNRATTSTARTRTVAGGPTRWTGSWTVGAQQDSDMGDHRLHEAGTREGVRSGANVPGVRTHGISPLTRPALAPGHSVVVARSAPTSFVSRSCSSRLRTLPAAG